MLMIKLVVSVVVSLASITDISDVSFDDKRVTESIDVDHTSMSVMYKLSRIDSLLNEKPNFNYANSSKRRDQATQSEFRTGY